MLTILTETNLDLLFETMLQIDGPFTDQEKVRCYLQKFVEREDCRAFIFVKNGEMLGYVACKLHEESRSEDLNLQLGLFGHIAKIGVREDARGRGIGKQLLEAGEQWIKSKGKPGVWLDYFPNGIRENFYKDYEVIYEHYDPNKAKIRRIAMKKW